MNKAKEKEHLQQLEKAGFVPHKHCTPRFAYLRGRGVNRQGEIKLVRTDMLSTRKATSRHQERAKRANERCQARGA